MENLPYMYGQYDMGQIFAPKFLRLSITDFQLNRMQSMRNKNQCKISFAVRFMQYKIYNSL